MPYDMNAYDPYDPEELRRRQLFDSMAAPSATPSAASSTPTIAPLPAVESRSPVQPIPPPNPQVDNPALARYRQVLEERPDVANYQPSKLRRVGAAVVGGLVGMGAGPEKGYAMGHQIAAQPFNAAMNRWEPQHAGAVEALGLEGKNIEDKVKQQQANTAEANEQSWAQRRLDQSVNEGRKGAALEFYRQQRIAIDQGKLNKKSDVMNMIDMIRRMQNGQDPEGLGDALMAYFDMKKPEAKPASPHQQFLDEFLNTHEGSTVAQAEAEYAKITQRPQQAPQALMITPEGRAVNVRPGTEVPQGSQTPSGVSTVNTPTSQTRAMAEMASSVLPQIPKLNSQVDALASKIGPGAGRWNNFWVNRAGMNDPEYAALNTNLDLFASALVRTHFGARGGQEYRKVLVQKFSEAQSPEDLKARINAAEGWIRGYASMGQRPKSNQPPDVPPPAEGGRVHRMEIK